MPHGTDAIPEPIRAWFAGECAMPWEAILPRERENVPAWWAAWCREHPGAKAPADALPGQLWHGLPMDARGVGG